MDFSYNLSDTEYLVFKTHQNYFELFSGYEGGGEIVKIATFKGGKWIWDSFDQQKMFWNLYEIFFPQFGKAIKSYNRSLKEKPSLYEFSCVRRRFSIKVTKLKRGWSNWFYGLHPTRNY
jgi:hypothetical protein